MKCKVKKNPILVILILSLIPIVFSIPIISIVKEKAEDILINLVMFVFVLPIFMVLVWALFHTYYEFTENELISKFGFITITIPYTKIKTVCFSNNPISSPSWTFKRIKIEYQKYEFALLSLPKDEDVFLKELKKRCPNATILNRTGTEVTLR